MDKKHDRKSKSKQPKANSESLFVKDNAKKPLGKDAQKTDVDQFLAVMIEMEKDKKIDKINEKKPFSQSDLSDNLLENEPGVGEVLKEFLERSSKK